MTQTIIDKYYQYRAPKYMSIFAIIFFSIIFLFAFIDTIYNILTNNNEIPLLFSLILFFMGLILFPVLIIIFLPVEKTIILENKSYLLIKTKPYINIFNIFKKIGLVTKQSYKNIHLYQDSCLVDNEIKIFIDDIDYIEYRKFGFSWWIDIYYNNSKKMLRLKSLKRNQVEKIYNIFEKLLSGTDIEFRGRIGP